MKMTSGSDSKRALDIETSLNATRKRAIMSGTPYVITKQFPWKLHEMLDLVEERGEESIVSWLPGGRAFRVHMPDVFVEKIMKLCFNQTKYKSFQRQLNLWGFERNTKECVEKGAYYHPLFLRGRRDLCQEMARHKVKGSAAGKKGAAAASISKEAIARNCPSPQLSIDSVKKEESNIPQHTEPVLSPSPVESAHVENKLLLPNNRDTALNLNEATLRALMMIQQQQQKQQQPQATAQFANALSGFDPVLLRALGVDQSALQAAEQEALNRIREQAALEAILQAATAQERLIQSPNALLAALSGVQQSLF